MALLPIAKTMIKSGFGAGELVRAAKLSFVRAAISEVLPSGKLNISRLSVATGLTRKEISLLLRTTAAVPTDTSRRIMEQRAFRVLNGWSFDPRFQSKNGRPADLELRSGVRPFSNLVKTYGGDVTPNAVLRELERIKAVSISKSGKVHLRSRAVRSRVHAAHQMLELARLIKDFSGTAQQVVIPRQRSVYFGFRDARVGSSHQAARFQRVFSLRAAALLASMDQWIVKAGREETNAITANDRFRIGLGVYLVQDD